MGRKWGGGGGRKRTTDLNEAPNRNPCCTEGGVLFQCGQAMVSIGWFFFLIA